MIIKCVKLVNFRNHSEYILKCDDETSLILGENGCGKTSVLEAIYILLCGKSFRAVDKEILKRGKDFYRIEVEYVNGEKTLATFDGEKKQFIVADKKALRLPKKNKYPVVLFLPSDLNLISNSPSARREYFDRIFSQLSEKYNNALLKYNKALKQRNELLKKEDITSVEMFSWNILLAKYGYELKQLREEFIGDINKQITSVYNSIAENNDEVELNISTDVCGDENFILKRLEQNFERDRILGHTSFGVHKDDYLFLFNNKLANGSASRGETRSVILALKFIEAKLIKEKTGFVPVVLLDDVFSELDEKRQRCLVKNFKDNQVIITSVKGVSI